MIAAIYARKSTEQNGVNEEEKSVTRQIDHAKAYALKKGWTVASDQIYSDDGISGVNFVSRPGFIRLMNALKPRPSFQVLIMSEESRLGRESIETAYSLKTITDAGVRVFFYLEDRERKLDSAMDKVMFSLASFGAEVEREKCRQRTHDAMRRKAERKEVTGCPVYGYDHVHVTDSSTDRPRQVRQINPEEARIIVRIFEEYATGTIGITNLAKQFNAEGIIPPHADRLGWAPTCVREILRRELYHGEVIWNKTQAIVRGGKETSRKRPESEWLRVDAPELRIVPEDLWQRVQNQITKRLGQYLRHSNGRLYGHPSGADIQSKYLLVGIAQCGACGASLAAMKRGSGGGQPSYMCLFHHKRGPSVCGNSQRINQDILDGALLKGIHGLLDEQIIAEAISRAVPHIQAEQAHMPDQRQELEREIAKAEGRLRRLVEAIATGRATEAVFAELEREEGKKKVLVHQLASLSTLTRLASMDATRLERNLCERIGDMKALLGRHVPQTRQLLRKIIDGRIVCTPFHDTRGRGYELAATGTYAGLLGDLGMVNNGGGGHGS